MENKIELKKRIWALMLAAFVLVAFMPQDAYASYWTISRVKKSTIKTYSVTSSSMRLKWKKVRRARTYRVAYRLNKKGAKWKYKTVKSPGAKVTGLSPNKKYAFKVRAVRWWRYGKWSGVIYKKTDTTQKDMLDQVNAQRKKKGLKKLKLYNEISKTAFIKAKDLKAAVKKDPKNGFSHKSKKLGMFYNQFEKADLIYWMGGENIAMGFPTVSSVMKAWMNSKGHRANILEKNYTHLGVGHYGSFWVQHFAQHPKKAGTLTCPYCGIEFGERKAGYDSDNGGYTTDSAENIVYVGVCPNCDGQFLKCPKCRNGVLPVDFDSEGHPVYVYDCSDCSYRYK